MNSSGSASSSNKFFEAAEIGYGGEPFIYLCQGSRSDGWNCTGWCSNSWYHLGRQFVLKCFSDSRLVIYLCQGSRSVGAGIAGLFSGGSLFSNASVAADQLSTFAKAAGAVAGIALVVAGIAGLFSGNRHINRTDKNRFVSEKTTADGKNWVRWVPPPTSWVKINTDGASQGNPGPAGLGVVIRDSSGAWLVGFKKALGTLGGTEAELMAIQEGLQLAWDEGYTSVLLQTDSQPALDHINGTVKRRISDDLLGVIYTIKKLKGRDWDCELSYLPREANKCADTVANMGIRGGSDLPIRSPPEEIKKHLQADMEGAWFLRR